MQVNCLLDQNKNIFIKQNMQKNVFKIRRHLNNSFEKYFKNTRAQKIKIKYVCPNTVQNC